VGQILTFEENVVREKKYKSSLRGGQLLAPGDVIQVMDQGSLVKCRVLSCLALETGACLASLEILEGTRKGERIQTTLRASEERHKDVDK
jgi:hypothetical protein